MPVIPLANDGAAYRSPRPSAPVTGEPQRGRDTGFTRIAQSLQAPEASGRGAMDQARAGAALGNAIYGVGEQIHKVAMERAEAQARVDVANGLAKLEDTRAAFENWKAENPDPRDWSEKWAEMAGAVDPFDPRMSAVAREELGTRHTRWLSSTAIDIESDATKQTFANARGLFTTRAKIAADNGDVEAVRQLTAEGAKYLHPGEDEYLLHSATKQKETIDRKAAYGKLYDEATSDPASFRDNYRMRPDDIEPGAWRGLQSAADETERDNVRATVTTIADAMAQGEIKTDADIDVMAGDTLNPATVEKIKAEWVARQAETVKAFNNSLEGRTKNFGALLAAVDAYDGSKENPNRNDEYVALRTAAEVLPSGPRGHIAAKLDGKFSPPKTPENPTVSEWGDDQLTDWLKDGRFGNLTRTVPDPEDPTKTKIITDEASRDKAKATRAAAQLEWMQWHRANPNASLKDAKSALAGIVRSSLLPSDISRLMDSDGPDFDPAAMIQRYGAPLNDGNPVNDLPSNPDGKPPVNLLLPPQ